MEQERYFYFDKNSRRKNKVNLEELLYLEKGKNNRILNQDIERGF